MLGFDLPGHRRRLFLISIGGVLGSVLSVAALPTGGPGPVAPAVAAVRTTAVPASGPDAPTSAADADPTVTATAAAKPAVEVLPATGDVPPAVPAAEVAAIVSAALATTGPGATPLPPATLPTATAPAGTGAATTPVPAATPGPASTAAPQATTPQLTTPQSPTPQPTTQPAAPAPVPAAAAGAGTSAATRYGWGNPVRVDDFTAGLGPDWGVYDGVGHDGRGTRSPRAVSVANGVMTITGSPDGTTTGMAWGQGQKYGRWEARVAAPASDPSYNAVALLWPDAENWPVGGEVDFMEMSDPSRRSTDMFLHYGKDNSQVSSTVQVDATTWHDWAVEWTPDHVVGYVDGVEWFRSTDPSTLPPGPMHLCVQLDWFPEGGAVRTSSMSVDWVRQYAL